MELNKCQTPLDKLEMSKEMKEKFDNYFYNIPFVRALVSPDRKYAKDLPRDEDGKIIVDLEHPHILENMDYFRKAAITFEKTGKYTELKPNTNPNSEYYKWVKEEVRRCHEGLIRPSDGEWVPGLLYYYLNYSEIQRPVRVQMGKSKKTVLLRMYKPPEFWDGTYWWYHYKHQAREEGLHCCMLSSRGRGKSFNAASDLSKIFKLGETKYNNTGCTCYITASDKKFLVAGDQTLDKFQHDIDYISQNTEWPGREYLANRLQDMIWIAGYKDLDLGNKGTGNSVVGMSSNNDVQKLRGTRAVMYVLEEAGCHLKGTEVRMFDGSVKKVEDIVLGDKLMGDDGNAREVLQLYSGIDKMYKITLSNGDYQIVNSKHPVYYKTYDWNKKCYKEHLLTAPELMQLDISKGYYISKSDKVVYPKQEVVIDPYWFGLWLGDGSSDLLEIANEDIEVLNWVEDYWRINNVPYRKRYCPQSKACYTIAVNRKNKFWEEFIKLNLRNNKHIPNCYKYNSKEVAAAVIAGLIDTDGTYDKRKHCYEVTQLYTRKHILDDIKEMCEYLGLRCSMSSRIAGKSSHGRGHLNYRLRIRGNCEILPVRIQRKKVTPRSGYKNKKCWTDYSFKVEEWGFGEYFGFTIDKNQLFLLKDYTIVHNTFANLDKVWSNTLPSVEQGQGDEREVFGQIIMYGCCCAGTKVWTSDGIEKNIEDLKLSDGILSWNGNNTECDIIRQQINLGKKQCVKLVTSAGRFLECSTDHPIYKATIHNYRNKDNKNKRDRVYEWDFVPAENLRIGDKVGIARHIESWGNEVLFDAYLTGVLIGDGSYGFDNTPKLSSEDVEILDYVKSNYDWSLNDTHITKKGRKYEEIRIKNICNELRNIGIYGQTKTNKRLPLNYKNLTKEDTLKLIAGIIDTDGCVFYHNKNALCYINIVQSSIDILKQIQFLIRKLGATSSIEKVNPTIRNDRKDKNTWYKLSINGNLNIKALKDLPLLVTRKKDALNAICNKEYIKSKHYNSDNIILDTIVDIQYLGEKEIYNMEVLNNHTYLANNFITHNTAGDKDSDFSSMGKMMYHPEGYHIKALHNIYDIEGKGAKQFSYFFPAYLNNAGCYDKNGNSDVTKAIYQILKDRETIKKKSGDINAIVKRTAEYPIVPQEAIMRVGDNRFPIAEINERIMQLEENEHEYDDTLVGILVQNPDGTVKFKPTSDNVITMYPLGDNKAEGALQIFKLPEKDNNGLVYSERYVIGHDPVNQDEADSVSLSSTFVIDMYTNSIVAEFTGRRQFQDESFEQLRLLSMFYNAQVLYEANNKMCYSYFSKMNCTYMLADTPEYLRERDIVKKQGFGNSAKGVSATAILNKHEDDLIEQFLLLPKTIYEKTPDGEEVAVTIHNVKTIRNLALLRELSSYGPDGNFDRVRALGVTLMLKHAYEVKYGGDVQSAQEPDVYNVFEDDFFKRNGIIH